MNGPVVALAHVGTRRTARRVRSDARRPWAWLGLAVVLAAIAGLQALALERSDAQGRLDSDVLDPLLAFGPLVLPLLLIVSTFTVPLRLKVADATWVLTAPGGSRAVVARDLLLRPLAFAALAIAATTIARAAVGRPIGEVWKIALAGATVGLAFRIVMFGGHLLVVRAKAAVALRVAAACWGAAMLAAAAFDGRLSDALLLRSVTEPLLEGVLEPSRLSAAVLLGALVVLLALAGAVLVAARGFEERAHVAARRLASAQEAFRQWQGGHEPALATGTRTGVSSLAGWDSLAGARAMAFRVLADQRHMVPVTMLGAGLLLDIGVPVVLLLTAPSFVWAWAAVGLLGGWFGAGAQLSIERDHHHLRLAPVARLAALLWLAAVPAAHRLISVQLSWSLAWLASGITLGTWAAGVLLIPCLIAFGEGAGALAVAAAERKVVRAAIKAAILVIVSIPATTVLGVVLELGVPALVAAVPTGAALLGGAWVCFATASRRIFGEALDA